MDNESVSGDTNTETAITLHEPANLEGLITPFIEPTGAAEVGLFRPLGDTGLNQYAGVVYEETAANLRGRRWYLTVKEMLNTSVVAGMMFAVEMLIRQAEWHLDPAEGDDIDVDEAERTRDFVESCRTDMRSSWEDTLAIIVSFVPYGFSLLEPVYKRRLGERDSQSSAYDDGLVGWDEWAPRAQETIDKWVFDDAGHVTAVVQRTASLGVSTKEIPMERLLHFRAGGYGGSPEGRSVLRPAFVDWDGVRKIQNIEAIGIERDLAGMPVALVPPEILGQSRTPAQLATFNGLKATLAGLRNNDQGGVIFPLQYDENGRELYKLSLMSTGGSRQFNTSDVVNRRNTQMASSMLADFLQIGHGSTGSYALSQDKTRLFTAAISAWCDLIADVINRQAIRRLLRVNGIDRRLAPTLRAGTLDAANLGEIGGFIQAVWPIMQATLDKADTVNVLQTLFDMADLPAITSSLETADEGESVSGDTADTPQDTEPPVDDESAVANPEVDDVTNE